MRIEMSITVLFLCLRGRVTDTAPVGRGASGFLVEYGEYDVLTSVAMREFGLVSRDTSDEVARAVDAWPSCCCCCCTKIPRATLPSKRV